MTLDGTDFMIYDVKPFDSSWYSHKFKGAGMRYEIGLSINTGDIVWFGGGYKAGHFNDLSMARSDFVSYLWKDKKVLGDKGYNDSRYFIYLKYETSNITKATLKSIMTWHKNINARVNIFDCMRQLFRHGWENITFVLT